MKKIYLAIPYTGMEESSYEQSTFAMGLLLTKSDDMNTFNYNVFSPITHAHPLTKLKDINLPGSWEFWGQIDTQFIEWADMVYVLIPNEGMSKVLESEGVQAEIRIAKSLNKEVKLIKLVNNKIECIENL